MPGAPYPENILQPPDLQVATGAPSAPQPDPLAAMAGLIEAMSQMNQAPLFPTPEARFAAGLTGLGAGLQGQANPAVTQALTQRKQDLDMLEAQMRNRLTLETLREKIREQQTAQRNRQQDMRLKVLEFSFKSENPAVRMAAAKNFGVLANEIGIPFSPEDAAGMANLPFDKKRVEHALLYLADPDVPPETVAEVTGLSPGVLGALNQLYKRAPTDPQSAAILKTFGVDLTDLQVRLLDMRGKRSTQFREAYGLTDDEGKALLRMSVKRFHKTFEELTPAQRNTLFDEFNPVPPGAPKTSEILSARQQFREDSKTFVKVRDSFTRLRGAGDTPAGDITLIVTFNHMIEPESIVKESEFDRTRVGNLTEKAKAYAEKYFGQGGMLTDLQRTAIRKEARKLFRGHMRAQELLEREHARGAADLKMQPGQIIFDFAGPLRGAAGQPSPMPGAREAEVRRLMDLGLSDAEVVNAMRKAGW